MTEPRSRDAKEALIADIMASVTGMATVVHVLSAMYVGLMEQLIERDVIDAEMLRARCSDHAAAINEFAAKLREEE